MSRGASLQLVAVPVAPVLEVDCALERLRGGGSSQPMGVAAPDWASTCAYAFIADLPVEFRSLGPAIFSDKWLLDSYTTWRFLPGGKAGSLGTAKTAKDKGSLALTYQRLLRPSHPQVVVLHPLSQGLLVDGQLALALLLGLAEESPGLVSVVC